MRTRLFVLFVLALWLCFPAYASIMLQSAEGTDPKLAAEVQRTIDNFNAIAHDELGVTLDKATFVSLCPTEACYIDALHIEAGYSYDKAALVGHVSTGLGVPGKRSVFLKLTNPAGLSGARFTMAHELTHMVQGQLSGEFGGMDKANRWIKEGMADWMGGLVANRMGSQSIDKWKLDRVNTLRSGSKLLEPDDMDAVSFNQWTRWMDEKRMPYEMADLMMMALAEKKGAAIFPALVGYMRCMDSFSFESTCFRENFGFSQRDFYAEFEAGFRRTLVGGKALEIVSDGVAPESAKLVESAFNQTQTLLREKLGSELPITLRIFLLPDRASMSAAIARELGRSPEEADKLAKGTPSLWQDSVVFFDVGRLDTPERLAAITASTVTGRYLQVVGNNKGQLSWLNNGLRDYFATATLDALGLRPLDQSMQQGLGVLRKATKGLPTLAELQTADSYRKAQSKYGNLIVSQYAAAAVRQLAADKGTAALGNWVQHSKTEADPAAAFATSLGEPTVEALDVRVKKNLTES